MKTHTVLVDDPEELAGLQDGEITVSGFRFEVLFENQGDVFIHHIRPAGAKEWWFMSTDVFSEDFEAEAHRVLAAAVEEDARDAFEFARFADWKIERER